MEQSDGAFPATIGSAGKLETVSARFGARDHFVDGSVYNDVKNT
jgi:hypothetical protein